jgi:hypothetical protein
VRGKKNGMSKRVVINNRTYDTIKEATIKTGISYYNIMKEVKNNVRFSLGRKV